MKQIDGERNFVAPPLKTAAVFGGIAGIMAGEQVEQDDLGSEFSFRFLCLEMGEVREDADDADWD
jgi:hypothetical protein